MIMELIVAAGCFWCVEKDFEKLDGVLEATSGYAGGVIEQPTYKNHDGYLEAVKIEYDSTKISFKELIVHYYAHSDYEDPSGAFCDRGYAYSPAIWVDNKEQEEIVYSIEPRSSIVPVYTEDFKPVNFHDAEEYHQDYYKKNPVRYNYYRTRCGRDKRVDQLANARMRDTIVETQKNHKGYNIDHLTPLQYEVTQKNATERPYSNIYDKHYEEGIYVDIVSGEALYSSKDKESSGTGWPSFTKTIKPDAVEYHDDWGWLGKRIEVRSSEADSHLGHVFHNELKNGKCIMSNCVRHCINSASLRFVPKAKMEEQGYGEYLGLLNGK